MYIRLESGHSLSDTDPAIWKYWNDQYSIPGFREIISHLLDYVKFAIANDTRDFGVWICREYTVNHWHVS